MERTEPTRATIVEAARRLVGTRFRHGGRSVEGVDCIGLLVVAYAAAGITLNAPNDYPRRPQVRYAFSQATSFAERISAIDARPGDIVQMNYGNMPVHFGILSDRGVIHAAALNRKVVEHAMPKVGNGRAAAFWRVKGAQAWLS